MIDATLFPQHRTHTLIRDQLSSEHTLKCEREPLIPSETPRDESPPPESAMKNMKKYHTQNTEDFTHIRTWLLCSFIKGQTRDKWNSPRQPMSQNQNQNQNLSQSAVSRGGACGSR